MVSSFTTRKRLEKQNPGENSNTWGGYLNTNALDLIDECFGLVCVAMTTAGDSILSTQNGATDQGRRSQIVLTGAPTSNVSLFAPAVQSFYLVRNKMTGANKVTLKNNGGTVGVDFSGSGSGAEQGLVVSDGTNIREVLRTVSIGAFPALTSVIYAAVSNANTDTTGGAAGDFIPFFDVSESGALNKVTTQKLFDNVLGDFTAKTSTGASDRLLMFDVDASVAKVVTATNFFKGINSMTLDATPALATDYLVSWDASASTAKKVTMASAAPAVPGVSNLLIVNNPVTPTTKVDVTFDQAVIVNSSGHGISIMSGSYTCDCTLTADINRLDTGSLANNTEYHIFIIAKPDGTGAGLLMSLSPTAPTLPAAYVGGFKYRIGCFITGGAATFMRIRQIGNRANYVVVAGSTTTEIPDFNISTNATKTALTAAGSVGAGLAQKVPSTAASIFLVCSQNGSTNSSVFVFPNNDAGYAATLGNYHSGVTGTGSAGEGGCMVELVLESTSIYYISGNNGGGASADLVCTGWRDRVLAS